jgi:predicted protein tyrosine phosphatase
VGDLHRVGGSPRSALRWAAVRTSAALSVLFFVVYFTTNWYSAQRANVGTWHYDWELTLPFVPLLIVPYMSIDLFFVTGPFLCCQRQELTTLARRLALTTLLGGACFLLFPYRLKFEKPDVDGWTGALFREFCSLDLPYNLVPSLHIAYLTILTDLYGRYTRGWLWVLTHLWFGLIGLSTVLTYQHQVIDVVGGVVLAAICFYLVRDPSPARASARNYRVANYYGVGAAVVLGVAAISWPWGGLLLWVAGSLLIAAAGYCGIAAGIYHKIDGRLTLSTRLIMAPLLVGQYASLLYYRRQCRAWDEAAPGVLIGRQLNDTEARELLRSSCAAVLDLTAEFSEAEPLRALRYRNIAILDLTAPTREQLWEAVDFITEQRVRGPVYVHCKIGYSRSAAVVGAYLLASGQAASADEAVDMLRKARPSIIVRPEAIDALHVFEKETGAIDRQPQRGDFQ